MSNLEHLIENTLSSFEKDLTVEEIENNIKNDINLKGSGITAEQCWEICQYIHCVRDIHYKQAIRQKLESYGMEFILEDEE